MDTDSRASNELPERKEGATLAPPPLPPLPLSLSDTKVVNFAKDSDRPALPAEAPGRMAPPARDAAAAASAATSVFRRGRGDMLVHVIFASITLHSPRAMLLMSSTS